MNSDIRTRFTGTGLALVTPFTKSRAIDFDALQRIIQRGISGGVEYLVVMGTTGEPVTLSKEEKSQVLAFVKNINSDRLPIVYGLGGNHTAEVLANLKEADLTGVSAILSVCPYYNKPSQEGIYQHYTAIADASTVPVILYNIPGRTGINMSVSTIVRLAEHDNIIGVKEASGDLNQCMEIAKRTKGKFLLISGDDLLSVPMIAVGAVGSIAVMPNLFPENFSEMIRAALKGDAEKARELLFSFTEINPLLYAEGNPVGAKAVLNILGLCEYYVRLPLVEASGELTHLLEKALDNLDAVNAA